MVEVVSYDLSRSLRYFDLRSPSLIQNSERASLGKSANDCRATIALKLRSGCLSDELKHVLHV